MKSIAPLAIGIGILLMALGVLWPVLFPATRTWTDEKSRRLKEISGKAQYAKGMIELAQRKPSMTGGESPAVLKGKLEEMTKEVNELRAEYSSAQDNPQVIGKVFKWSGVSVMALGVVGYLATKDA